MNYQLNRPLSRWRKLRHGGGLSIENIAQATGLSQAEVEALN
ncbi:hypothetical protein [Treponema medium]|nr:hypothetical protein [Treponema medium]